MFAQIVKAVIGGRWIGKAGILSGEV